MSVRCAAALALFALFALFAPASARAGCPEERVAEQAFGHPYGEPSKPCGDEAERGRTADADMRDDAPPPRTRTLAISGMGGGAAVAGLGGVLVLTSLFVPADSATFKITRYGGIGIAALGGAMFVTGAVFGVIDLASGDARPRGRGAEVSLAFRF